MRNSQKMMIAVLLMAVIALTSVSSSISLLSATTNPVVNSFTFTTESGGSISLKVDEALIENGEATSSRTTEGNTYYVEAGKTISKDPTVTVDSGSEEAYVFMYMDNNLSTDYFTINCSNSWTQIATSGTKSLYIYKSKVDAASGDQTLDALFTKIEVAETIPEDFISSFGSQTITLQAYAVGSDVEVATAITQAAEYFGFTSYDTTVTVSDN